MSNYSGGEGPLLASNDEPTVSSYLSDHADGDEQAPNSTKMDPSRVDITQCAPTQAHMALYRLIELQRVQHVVSQNVDSLHRRSGLKRENLSEIHGNACIEYCPVCTVESSDTSTQFELLYPRRFDVTGRTSKHRHQTTRRCQCGEQLFDTIVHYGEKAR